MSLGFTPSYAIYLLHYPEQENLVSKLSFPSYKMAMIIASTWIVLRTNEIKHGMFVRGCQEYKELSEKKAAVISDYFSLCWFLRAK